MGVSADIGRYRVHLKATDNVWRVYAYDNIPRYTESMETSSHMLPSLTIPGVFTSLKNPGNKKNSMFGNTLESDVPVGQGSSLSAPMVLSLQS